MRKMLITVAIALLLAIASPAGAAGKTYSDTLELEQKYKLHLESVNAAGSYRTATLQLLHGGVADERFVVQRDNFRLYDGGTLIVNATLDSVFVASDGYYVQIRYLVQYDKYTGEIIRRVDRVLLFVPYHAFKLKQGYELLLVGVDDRSSPQQIWLLFRRHGAVIDGRVVDMGDDFSFYDGGALVLKARFYNVSRGGDGYFVQLKDLYQYNQNGDVILSKESVILEKPY